MTQQEEHLFSPDQLILTDPALNGSVSIPPCPAIVAILLEEVGKEIVDYGKLVRLVTRDAGMASATLKLANSPLFGAHPRVTSVQQAVLVLGLRNLLKVIYGVALKQSVAVDGNSAMHRFWERSGYNAAVCAYLATSLFGEMSDDAHNFGLFHDAGIAVLLQQLPTYRDTLKEANAAPQDWNDIEYRKHKITHTQVGAILAKEWRLPDHVVWAIHYHHHYHLLAQPVAQRFSSVFRLVAIRLLSEHYVTRFLGFEVDPEWDYANPVVRSYLGLTEDAFALTADAALSYLTELHENNA